MRTEIRQYNPWKEYEAQYESERLYLEQTASWKAGMRYRYCPESYPITTEDRAQFSWMGCEIGSYLKTRFPGNQVIEFRVDCIRGRADDRLYLAEIGIDDRGLPAMMIARNARGNNLEQRVCRITKNTVEPLIRALKDLTGREDPRLLIVYPKEEEFYYEGFYDVASICWGVDRDVEILVASIENVRIDGQRCLVRIERQGLDLVQEPDLIWNFTENPIEVDGAKNIQPLVDKSDLKSLWEFSNISRENFLPETVSCDDERVLDDKDSWVIKPIDGRWSRGIVFGIKVSQGYWQDAIQDGGLVAQKYIEPKEEVFLVRNKNGSYSRQRRSARVEGYFESGEYRLTDVLATCTQDYPVHGCRDSIMIPGQIVPGEDSC
jgi:hypothetical protein